MNQSKSERQAHVDKVNQLSISRQCELVQISRSSFYYKSLGESSLNLELMELIDREYMEHPWMGVPRMTTWLRKDQGFNINKTHRAAF